MRGPRLGVNIDHVATIRNARGGGAPDPLRAALLAEKAGADGITAHLREDRRHIGDTDIEALMAGLTVPLNFEMAATAEMLGIALRHRPHAACIVPEKREERTTEGGLGVAQDHNRLAEFIAPLREAGCRVSMFIEADPAQIEASARIGAPVIELHTGTYAEAHIAGDTAKRAREFERLAEGVRIGVAAGLEVHLGHGLDFETARMVSAIPDVAELNIGHFLIGESVFIGLEEAMRRMRAAMDEGYAGAGAGSGAGSGAGA